ncbi:MAG: VOC family protein [Thermoplasmata archaeon]|nr:VOC family protein [Thermoplasmata archaeon]
MADEPTAAPVFAPLLVARDFAATLAFYQTVLDLTPEGSAPYAKLVSNSSTISIVDGRWWGQVSGAESAYHSEAGASNLVLMVQVKDVEATFERLAGLGVRFLAPPTVRSKMGIRNVFLRDPDGRTVMLSSPLD